MGAHTGLGLFPSVPYDRMRVNMQVMAYRRKQEPAGSSCAAHSQGLHIIGSDSSRIL